MIVALANTLVLLVPILVGTRDAALWFTWLDTPDSPLALATTFGVIAFAFVAGDFTKPYLRPAAPALPSWCC